MAPVNRLTFQYNDLVMEPGLVIVEWTLSANNTCSLFNATVQGFTLDQIVSNDFSNPVQSISAIDSNRARITSDQLTTAGREPLFYRVAVFDNGTICPHVQSDITFYQFNGMLHNTAMGNA